MAMTVTSAASDEQIVPDQGGLLVLEQLHDDPDLLEVVMCLAADVTNGEAADVTTHQVRYMFSTCLPICCNLLNSSPIYFANAARTSNV